MLPAVFVEHDHSAAARYRCHRGFVGGLEALTAVLRGLPADFDAALFIVQHIGAWPSLLPEILSRIGTLPTAHARDGEPIEHGRVYIAPPDYHMVLERDCVRLDSGPKEHHTPPAADPLFRSAAATYGPRVVGVVLTGGDSDGTKGMQAITNSGGVGIVQEPDEAKVPDMPENAMKYDKPNYSLSVGSIAPLLIELRYGRSDDEEGAREPTSRPEPMLEKS